MVSGLKFKFLLHFQFCAWCERVVQFDSFACNCTVFPTLFIKRLSFPHCIFCLLCCRLIGHESVGSFLGSVFCSIHLCVCFCASTIPF